MLKISKSCLIGLVFKDIYNLLITHLLYFISQNALYCTGCFSQYWSLSIFCKHALVSPIPIPKQESSGFIIVITETFSSIMFSKPFP